MTIPMVRGYCISKASNFVHDYYDSTTRQRVEQSFSFELRSTLEQIQPERWYPRALFSELLSALCEVRDASLVHDDLLRCGRFIGEQGTNEFMKLALKILTPELLVKKLPRLWLRDYGTNGCLKVVATEPERKRASLVLENIAGCDHVSVAWLGWMKALFIELCGPGVLVAQQGWSVITPGPESVSYEVIWA